MGSGHRGCTGNHVWLVIYDIPFLGNSVNAVALDSREREAARSGLIAEMIHVQSSFCTVW